MRCGNIGIKVKDLEEGRKEEEKRKVRSKRRKEGERGTEQDFLTGITLVESEPDGRRGRNRLKNLTRGMCY